MAARSPFLPSEIEIILELNRFRLVRLLTMTGDYNDQFN